jgi:hypothetical protein
MHDPFDPRFASDVGESVGKIASPIQNDPWCIGYFVDNELSWGGMDSDRSLLGLAYGALAETAASSPAKQALLAQLQAQYRTIPELNARWEHDFLPGKDWSRPGIRAALRARRCGLISSSLSNDLPSSISGW